MSILGGKIQKSVSMGSVLQEGFLWWREKNTPMRKRAFNCALRTFPVKLFNEEA